MSVAKSTLNETLRDLPAVISQTSNANTGDGTKLVERDPVRQNIDTCSTARVVTCLL